MIGVLYFSFHFFFLSFIIIIFFFSSGDLFGPDRLSWHTASTPAASASKPTQASELLLLLGRLRVGVANRLVNYFGVVVVVILGEERGREERENILERMRQAASLAEAM